MGKRYVFHSPLPPARIPGILSGEFRFYDQLENTEVYIRTKWKNRRFAVGRTTVYRYAAAALYLCRFIHAVMTLDFQDGTKDILRFLRENFEEVEE